VNCALVVAVAPFLKMLLHRFDEEVCFDKISVSCLRAFLLVFYAGRQVRHAGLHWQQEKPEYTMTHIFVVKYCQIVVRDVK
jgi:hypothetical protein